MGRSKKLTMENFEGLLALAVVKVARDKLVTAMGDAAVTMPENLRRDLQQLKERMETMAEVLEDAERHSIRDGAVREWLMRLEDAAYAIWDMADEFQVNKGPKIAAHPCLPMAPKRTMASTTNETKENLNVLYEELESFAFQKENGKLEMTQQSVDAPETASVFYEETIIVGRDEKKELILNCLLTAEKDISRGTFILAIIGLAGIGKTTLAKIVFSDTTLLRDYSRAWVNVREDMDLKKIGNCILSQLSKGEHQDSNDVEFIVKRLDELLGAGNKVLVVLDDLWSQHIEGLKRMLGVGKKDSKAVVIVTTRRHDVARMFAHEVVTISPLSELASLELLQRKFGIATRRHDPRWVEILKQVARMCGGLPLAIHALGSALRSKSPEEIISLVRGDIWVDCGRNYFIFHPLSLRSPEDRILEVLRLSYWLMPPNLRLCFAYCGIFPSGHNILKDDLIHQWTALHLIEPSARLSTTQMAHKYIEMLLGMSFLQPAMPASITRGKDWRAESFVMHDLVREIAIAVARGNLIVLDGRRGTPADRNNYRHARLTNFDVSPLNLSGSPLNLSGILSTQQLRALLFQDCSSMKLSDDSFSSAKHLRVLDLQDCRLQKLPDSICQLRQLRYLNLSGWARLLNLSDSFGNLINVGYLDLSGCSGLLKLPVSFGNLINVMHLDLSGCSGLLKLPVSFGNLINVMHLDLSGCSGLLKLPASFGNLTNVVHIDLSGCSGLLKLQASFGNLTNVVHLDLSGCIALKSLTESFGNLSNVTHINLSGCVGLVTLPESFKLLEKLEYLDLSSCSCLKGIPSALDGLTNLQHLNLSHPCCYLSEHRFHLKELQYVWVKLINLRYLNLSMSLNPVLCYLSEQDRTKYIESISGLRSLEHLNLSHNIFLYDLPKGLDELSQLQTLDLSGCARLKRVDKWMGEMNCPKKFIVVSNCRGLETYQFVVRADDGAQTSNLVQLKDVSCKELEISCLEKVKSTEEARSIRLIEKKKLQKLALYWSADRDKKLTDASLKDDALLAQLVPSQNLQCFEIHGYSSECLPAWLTSCISSHLPNLVEVAMVDIPRCSNLPPLGMLPNLQRLVLRRLDKVTRIDAGDLSGDTKAAFRCLLHVSLDSMENLKEFNTCSNSGEPTLDELVINSCPNLRFGDIPPKARMLLISDCDQLMTSLAKRGKHAVEGPSTSTCTTSAGVTELVIEGCEVPLAESKWSLLQGLDPLHSLHFRNCSDQTISAEATTALSSLQLLCFSRCDSMTYLPEHWLGLTSLQELVIDECGGLKYLPESMFKETNKQGPLLRIRDCPDLKKWCELEENKTKLAHIQPIFEESSTTEPETTAHRKHLSLISVP